MTLQTAIKTKGFTLIEVTIAIVLLAIATTAIISLNGNLFFHSSDIQTIQKNAQLLQACADRVIGIRKAFGYNALMTAGFDGSCASISSTLSITSISTPSGCPLITDPSYCRQVEIRVTGYNTPVTLYFVNY